MTLDQDVCYRALQTRDARFDGRFFTAVRSTGIYCRPICPAQTPKRENCVFVPCAAAAQEKGFRPCLRCRPEASPGTPAWLGTSATVSRALRLISDGALDDGGVEGLAARLGVGDRHLRRLFMEHLGASPVAVGQTRRILFAKKLINETELPMTEVAFASGFSSIRRFNDAMRKTYNKNPSELRRQHRQRPGGHDAGLTLILPYRPPYNWNAAISYLAGRATPGVEAVDDNRYLRTISIETGGVVSTGVVEVSAAGGEHHLLARIRVDSTAVLIQVAERVRRIFDLGADPEEISSQLRRDKTLKPAITAAPGLRVPGAWSGFELAVRAILGQQVSVKSATTLAGRVAQRWGSALDSDDSVAATAGLTHIFPSPARLAKADLTSVGVIKTRAQAIRGLAQAVEAKRIDLDSSRGLDDSIRALCELSGIGEWTAHYIAMRALHEPDAFPAGDLGLQRAVANGQRRPSATALLALAENWRPWRAYAAMHLWNMEATDK
jgi:AraC family transcriptional regulator of adaptative response / DNA-3-methyladenine glycosylase II